MARDGRAGGSLLGMIQLLDSAIIPACGIVRKVFRFSHFLASLSYKELSLEVVLLLLNCIYWTCVKRKIF